MPTRTTPTPQGPRCLAAYDGILQRLTPFTSLCCRAFVAIDRGRTLSVRSHAFRKWFFGEVHAQHDTTPSAHAFSAIRHHLEALAARIPENVGVRVPHRVDARRSAGPLPETLFLDLANQAVQCVEISSSGWRVQTRDNLPFETSRAILQLPNPQPPDPQTLDRLRAALHLADTSEWLRLMAWILTALRTDVPYPILILRGPSGSGKSLAARLLRGLVDPSRAPIVPMPSTSRGIHTLAQQNWLLAFDHVSHLKPPIAETLCQLTNGIALTLREEGSREPVSLWVRRPILLTVTEDFIPPPDLAARAITVTLPELTAETRRPEQDLMDDLNDARPQILGAICDTLSTILRAGTLSTQPHPTRHLDALAWTLAAAPALKATEEEIRQAFDNPPPLIQSLKALQPWTGTATELAERLSFTSAPKLLTEHLKKYNTLLNQAGLTLTFHREHAGIRKIALSASPTAKPASSPQALPRGASPAPATPSTSQPPEVGQTIAFRRLSPIPSPQPPAPNPPRA